MYSICDVQTQTHRKKGTFGYNATTLLLTLPMKPIYYQMSRLLTEFYFLVVHI